jgi:hypothetical protein
MARISYKTKTAEQLAATADVAAINHLLAKADNAPAAAIARPLGIQRRAEAEIATRQQ